MCMVCSENDLGENDLRTQASERGVGWGLGWPVPARKLLVKLKLQLGLYHDCAFMLI